MLKTIVKAIIKALICTAILLVVAGALSSAGDAGILALCVLCLIGAVVCICYVVKQTKRKAKEAWDNLPVPVSTELLTTETVGIGRGASAAIGSLLGGDLGMVAGAVGGGRKQYATFLVTYSDGSVKNEQVKVNSPTYKLYMSLRGK